MGPITCVVVNATVLLLVGEGVFESVDPPLLKGVFEFVERMLLVEDVLDILDN